MKRLLLSLALGLLVSGTCLAAPVTSPFGWRVHPIAGVERFHTGADIGYDYGEPVQAVLPGRVVFAGVWGGYGNCVILEHTNGDHTLYGHMSAIDVAEGDTVSLYGLLGAIGSTGYSTGPHLHLEWWHNGEYVDPLPLYSMTPEEAYGYAPVRYDAPIQAVFNENGTEGLGMGDGPEEGFGFGFDKPEGSMSAVLPDARAGKPERPVKKRMAAPEGYTAAQAEQMRQAARAEAFAEAKRQARAEAEASKERVFFRLGFD